MEGQTINNVHKDGSMTFLGGVTCLAAAVGGVAYYYRNELDSIKEEALSIRDQFRRAYALKKNRKLGTMNTEERIRVSEQLMQEMEELHLQTDCLTGKDDSDQEKSANNDPTIIPKARLISLFKELCASQENVLDTLEDMKKQIKARSNATGNDISDDHLQKELCQSFHMNFKKIESEALSRHNINEPDLHASIDAYKDDKEFTELFQKFKALSSTYGPAPDLPTVPDTLTIHRLLSILEETMHSANELLVTVSKDVKDKNPDSSKETILQIVQQRTFEKIKTIESNVHAKYGYTREIIQGAVVKFQSDEVFLKRLQEITQQQQHFLRENGL